MECSLSLQTERWRVFTASFTQDFILSRIEGEARRDAPVAARPRAKNMHARADGENNLKCFRPASRRARRSVYCHEHARSAPVVVESLRRRFARHGARHEQGPLLFEAQERPVGTPLLTTVLRARGRIFRSRNATTRLEAARSSAPKEVSIRLSLAAALWLVPGGT